MQKLKKFIFENRDKIETVLSAFLCAICFWCVFHSIYEIYSINKQSAEIQKEEEIKSYEEIIADYEEMKIRIDELTEIINNQKDLISVMRDQIDILEKENEELMEIVNEIIIDIPSAVPDISDRPLNQYLGVVYFNGHKETYYNLDMIYVVSYAKEHIDILEDADYWIRNDGAKMLGDYIMVAADYHVHPYGSLVETSLGTGIVVDTGIFTAFDSKQIDIATNW